MPTDSRFNRRRRSGRGALFALLAVPLLLALTACGGLNGAVSQDTSVPSVATSTGPSSAAAAGPTGTTDDRKFGPMSIVRNGTGFTLTGEFPDAATKASLVQSIAQAMPGAKITDQLTVNPAVKGPEFSALGALFGTALDIEGFSSTLVGNTLTLRGRAPAVDVKAAALAAAGVAWPNVTIINDIQVVTSTPPPPPAPPTGPR